MQVCRASKKSRNSDEEQDQLNAETITKQSSCSICVLDNLREVYPLAPWLGWPYIVFVRVGVMYRDRHHTNTTSNRSSCDFMTRDRSSTTINFQPELLLYVKVDSDPSERVGSAIGAPPLSTLPSRTLNRPLPHGREV